MLCFQAKAVAPFVNVPLFSDDGSVQEVTRIKLHSRLSRINFQHSSTGWFVDPGSQSQAVTFTVDHKIVIVSVPDYQLLVTIVDASANRGGLGEIQRRSLNRANFAGGDQSLVHRREAARR